MFQKCLCIFHQPRPEISIPLYPCYFIKVFVLYKVMYSKARLFYCVCVVHFYFSLLHELRKCCWMHCVIYQHNNTSHLKHLNFSVVCFSWDTTLKLYSFQGPVWLVGGKDGMAWGHGNFQLLICHWPRQVKFSRME